MAALLLLAGASGAFSAPPTAGPELVLSVCSASSPSQVLALHAGTLSNGSLAVATSTPAFCVDIANFDTNPGAQVYTWECGRGSKLNEFWQISPAQLKSRQVPPTCLAATASAAGARVTTALCNAADPLQAFSFSASSGLLALGASGLCADTNGTYVESPWCTLAPQKAWPICDGARGLDERAADIVGRLSAADKIAALVTATAPLGSIGLPSYQWWSEATHGIGGPGVRHTRELPGATNTALPITTSCSFNRTFVSARARAF